MRNFTTEDFSGCGQYLIRLPLKGDSYKDTGFMTTVMYKVGFMINNLGIGNGEQLITLTAMSDGMTTCYHYYKENKDDVTNFNDKVIWQGTRDDREGGIRKFVEYLNNPVLSQEMRFATQEEITRVVMYQSSRWRN